jgi:hypothetical protein
MAPGSDLWVNTVKYSVPSLIVFGVGAVLWVVTYISVLLHVR